MSCTPPSTSLSTSASVEEDDDIINANSVNLTSKVEEISIAELSNVEESEVKEVTLKTSDSTLPKTSIFLPDLLQLGQQRVILTLCSSVVYHARLEAEFIIPVLDVDQSTQ